MWVWACGGGGGQRSSKNLKYWLSQASLGKFQWRQVAFEIIKICVHRPRTNKLNESQNYNKNEVATRWRDKRKHTEGVHMPYKAWKAKWDSPSVRSQKCSSHRFPPLEMWQYVCVCVCEQTVITHSMYVCVCVNGQRSHTTPCLFLTHIQSYKLSYYIYIYIY